MCVPWCRYPVKRTCNFEGCSFGHLEDLLDGNYTMNGLKTKDRKALVGILMRARENAGEEEAALVESIVGPEVREGLNNLCKEVSQEAPVLSPRVYQTVAQLFSVLAPFIPLVEATRDPPQKPHDPENDVESLSSDDLSLDSHPTVEFLLTYYM